MSLAYDDFITTKLHLGGEHGFSPESLPPFLFDFQTALVEWALRKGRAALFADCGLGKTPMQLVWADQVARHTRRPVLIAAPLAVSHQIIREAEKFGIDATRSQDGTIPAGTPIVVTNYERVHLFNPADFSGMVCDESSILKNFDGTRRATVTEFLRTLPYRLLCTATAAPNDYIELGTSSEALGDLGHMDMLGRFFVNRQKTSDTKGKFRGFSAPRAYVGPEWRFKGHAEEAFWRWVCSWARALRRPSDLGFGDYGFELPPLEEREHVVTARTPHPERLFDLPSQGLHEERVERRRTISERCERVAELVDHGEQALVWCHLNAESDLLERLIPDAVQVQGSDPDDDKEAKLFAFAEGNQRVLVTKPKIGAWGLNLQRCAHTTFFPSHSYEQYYQGVRRCWRFGQERPVVVDIVSTALVQHKNDAVALDRRDAFTQTPEVPAWL
jgi:hypothetical protein